MISGNTSPRTAVLQAHIPPETAWLLCQPEDIRYYTGFDCLVSTEREAYLVLTATEAFLIHAGFSPITTVFPHVTTRPGAFTSQLAGHLQEIQALHPFSELCCDFEHLMHAEYLALEKNASFTITSLNREAIIQQRMLKDATEQTYITHATQITTVMFDWIQSQFVEGVTERQLAQKLYTKMIELGGDITPAFPFIVAFGEHSALPHHQPTDTPLTLNTAVLIDMGARVQNYCSDMTRTFWFGPNPDSTFTEIKDVVHAAYTAAEAIASDQPVTAREVDEAAREVIKKAGYGDEFIHTTGHGLGLEIHEQPSLNWRNTEKIQPNMAITIEPGIYLPGKFGYRYENTLIID
ncbi:MAG: M24 family metallopeptidase [Candidatus Pacebacteria bacterium]|nr:M24 family metallopeptidase [Candidatus Paceibacterota bacterium]